MQLRILAEQGVRDPSTGKYIVKPIVLGTPANKAQDPFANMHGKYDNEPRLLPVYKKVKSYKSDSRKNTVMILGELCKIIYKYNVYMIFGIE